MSLRLPLKDIQFIADFAAYARSRGGDAYDYVDPRRCAACQFLRDIRSFEEPCVNAYNYRDGALTAERTALPAGVNAALVDCDGSFAALAGRLEALLVDTPMVTA